MIWVCFHILLFAVSQKGLRIVVVHGSIKYEGSSKVGIRFKIKMGIRLMDF